MDMATSVNPATDAWLEARDHEIRDYGDCGSMLADPVRKAAQVGIDSEEMVAALEMLVADLRNLHGYANISLLDIEIHLNTIRAAALYLMSTL